MPTMARLKVASFEFLGFEFFTSRTMKNTVFWIVTVRSTERVQHFRGTCWLSLQGQRERASNQQKLSFPSAFIGILLGLVLIHEDESDMFL
jgi:hypothetical protein